MVILNLQSSIAWWFEEVVIGDSLQKLMFLEN